MTMPNEHERPQSENPGVIGTDFSDRGLLTPVACVTKLQISRWLETAPKKKDNGLRAPPVFEGEAREAHKT